MITFNPTLPLSNCLGINENVRQGATLEQATAIHHDITRLMVFALQVEILLNTPTSKKVIVLTTFQGDQVDFDLLTIEEVSGSALDSFSYTQIGGKAGAAILDLPEATASVFVFHARYTNDVTGKTYQESKLVSFGAECACEC